MIKRVKRESVVHAHPLWLRVLAYACLLLVVGASSIQAIHIHGQWLPQKAIRVAAAPHDGEVPDGPLNCPLCMAMHTALPVAAYAEQMRLELVECRLFQAVDRAPETQWHFTMFSRPPPAGAIFL